MTRRQIGELRTFGSYVKAVCLECDWAKNKHTVEGAWAEIARHYAWNHPTITPIYGEEHDPLH